MKAFIEKKKFVILGVLLGITALGLAILIYIMDQSIKQLEQQNTQQNVWLDEYESVITDYSEILCKYESEIEHLTTPMSKEELSYIAHAMGGIDSHPYTNSVEAFKVNYKKGYRLFEVDLLFTSDDVLVARHEWSESDYERFEQLDLIDLSQIEMNEREEYVPTSEQFLSMKINGQYTPMTFDDVIQLMQDYPDAIFITDTKWADDESVEKAFKAIVEQVKQVDESLLSRLIPQLYTLEMFDVIEEIYEFDSYVYTMYQEVQRSNYDVIEFINEHDEIAFVTMPQALASIWGTPRFDLLAQLQYLKKPIFFHTINDEFILEELLNYGASGVYTDELFYSGNDHEKTCTYNSVIKERDGEENESK